MELWLAVVLMLLSAAGIVASTRCLRRNRALRIAYIVICAVLTAVFAGYVGLTLLFVGRRQDLCAKLFAGSG